MLQAAYFSFFKDHSDILLFWGDDAELCGLRDALDELSSTGKGHYFAGQNCGIDLRLAGTSAGASRQGERSFDWAIDRRDAADFRDTVAALIASDRPGHQYLACGTPAEITVMVSRAEYPPALKAEPLPKRREPSRMRVTGWLLVAAALLVQVLAIAEAWYDFDPRLSCDRLPHWGEWFSCLHGTSHPHIILIDIAALAWAAAGLTMLLGRILPSFVSAVVPILLTLVLVLGAILHWTEVINPHVAYDDLTLEVSVLREKIAFAIRTALEFACFVLPAAGTWLLGLRGRHAEG